VGHERDSLKATTRLGTLALGKERDLFRHHQELHQDKDHANQEDHQRSAERHHLGERAVQMPDLVLHDLTVQSVLSAQNALRELLPPQTWIANGVHE